MSTIVTDTLQGKTSATSITLPTTTNIGSTPLVSASANSMTIRGEGSAVTNIQQGLAKVWNNIKQTGTQSIQDSFNVSGITDTAVGFTTTSFSNPMNNTGYSITACSEYNTMQGINTSVSATGAHGFVNLNSGGSYEDRDDSCLQIMGDLA